MNCTPKELMECLRVCKYIKGESLKSKCWDCKACVRNIPCKDFISWWTSADDKKFRKQKRSRKCII